MRRLGDFQLGWVGDLSVDRGEDDRVTCELGVSIGGDVIAAGLEFPQQRFRRESRSPVFASRSHRSQSWQLGRSGLKPPTASNAVLRTIVEDVLPRMFTRHKSAKVATGPCRLCRGPLSSCKYNMLQPTAGHSGRRARMASCSSVLVGSHSSSESRNANRSPVAAAAPMLRALGAPRRC